MSSINFYYAINDNSGIEKLKIKKTQYAYTESTSTLQQWV